MARKPTYEEIEQRVQELEKEILAKEQTERALQESEERLKAILDNSTTVVYLKDIDGQYLLINKHYEQLFHITREQIIGKTDYDIFPRETAEKFQANDIEVLKRNTSVEFEELAPHDDGIHSYISIKFPLYNVDGEAYAVCGISADITEQKRAEEMLREAHDDLEQLVKERTVDLEIANEKLKREIEERKQVEEELRESENRYRSLFKNNHSAMLLIDPKSADIIDANPGAVAFYGWSHEELTSKKITNINTLTENQVFQEIERAKTEQRQHFYFQHCLASGEIRDVEVYSGPIKIHGKQLLYSIIHDITDRKKAEVALRESEERYRTVLEANPDPVVVYDIEGKVIYFNPAFTRVFGWTLEERINKKMDVFVPEDTWEETKAMIDKVLAGESFSGIESRRFTKEGKIVPVSISGAIYRGRDNNPIGSVINLRDISEQKTLENQLQQSQKMEALGTLVGGIAHEFNNILGIIIGNTELALDDVPERNPVHYNLKEIKTAGLRAKDVVRQLLSYIRKVDYKKKPMKAIPVVKDSIKFLRSTIPTSIDIRQNMQATADTILADPTQIHQIMLNLCTNSSHAIEEDGGVLEIEIQNVNLGEESVSIDPDLIPGNYLKITVSDTGQGISPDIIDRIFDPFFTTKEVGKGVGLGLSVVHGIVKSYGGSMTVFSELGKGTFFTAYFPIVEEDAAIESKPVEEEPTGNERILFVDDEESIVTMGRQRLERLGYQIESTISSLEALDLFRSKPDHFDLVITDLTMPKMTGDKLVKEILNIRPDMPIIICTGFSEKMDGEKARATGALGYLEKPHEKRKLAMMVRKVLDRK